MWRSRKRDRTSGSTPSDPHALRRRAMGFALIAPLSRAPGPQVRGPSGESVGPPIGRASGDTLGAPPRRALEDDRIESQASAGSMQCEEHHEHDQEEVSPWPLALGIVEAQPEIQCLQRPDPAPQTHEDAEDE